MSDQGNRRKRGDKNLNPDEMFDTNKYVAKKAQKDARAVFPDIDSLCLLDAVELAMVNKTHFIPCDSLGEAKGMRLMFYKFMTRLKEADTFEGEWKGKVEFEVQENGLLISLKSVSQRTTKYLAKFNKARENIGLGPLELSINGNVNVPVAVVKESEEEIEIKVLWEDIPEGKRKRLPGHFEMLFKGTGTELEFTREQWEGLGDD
jgi:hypothetical protein